MLTAKSVHAVDVNVQRYCHQSRDPVVGQYAYYQTGADCRLQSKQREAEEGLVNLAHHDASAIIPVADIAEVCQSSPHPP